MSDSIYKSNTVGRFIASPELMPKRKTKGSAGYDFIAPETVTIEPHSMVQFDTGVKVAMRDGFILKLYVRSSLGKRGITLTNAVGIIDSDYHDSMQALLLNNSDEPYTILKGERYMQGIFTKYFITDNDEVDAVRSGGFGSTGR